jgi:hypothetical protein
LNLLHAPSCRRGPAGGCRKPRPPIAARKKGYVGEACPECGNLNYELRNYGDMYLIADFAR